MEDGFIVHLSVTYEGCSFLSTIPANKVLMAFFLVFPNIYLQGGHKRQACGKPCSNSMSYSWKTFKDKNDERQGQEEAFIWHSRVGGVANKQQDPRLEVWCASPLLEVVTHVYQQLISLPDLQQPGGKPRGSSREWRVHSATRQDCSLPGFSVHGDSPGKNTGVG